jgi:hypothetical protein
MELAYIMLVALDSNQHSKHSQQAWNYADPLTSKAVPWEFQPNGRRERRLKKSM